MTVQHACRFVKLEKLEWVKDEFDVDGDENLDFSGNNNFQNVKDVPLKLHPLLTPMSTSHALSIRRDLTLVSPLVSMAERFWVVES